MSEIKTDDAFKIFQSLLLTKDIFGTKVVRNNTDSNCGYALSMKGIVEAADKLQPHLKEWYEWQEKMRRAKGTPGEIALKKEHENWYWGTVLDGLADDIFESGMDISEQEEDDTSENAPSKDGKAQKPSEESCDQKKNDDGVTDVPEEYKKLFIDEYVAEMARVARMVDRNFLCYNGIIFLQIDGLGLLGPTVNKETIRSVVEFLEAAECQIVLLYKDSTEISYHSRAFFTFSSLLGDHDLSISDIMPVRKLYADACIQTYIDPEDEKELKDMRWVMFGDFETWNPEIKKHIIPLDWTKPVNEGNMMRAISLLTHGCD